MTTNSNHQAVIALRHLGFQPINIRQGLLKVVGKSQAEVAEALGVSRQTVNLHLSALRKNPDVVHGISAILDVPVEILFPDVASWLQQPEYSA